MIWMLLTLFCIFFNHVRAFHGDESYILSLIKQKRYQQMVRRMHHLAYGRLSENTNEQDRSICMVIVASHLFGDNVTNYLGFVQYLQKEYWQADAWFNVILHNPDIDILTKQQALYYQHNYYACTGDLVSSYETELACIANLHQIKDAYFGNRALLEQAASFFNDTKSS